MTRPSSLRNAAIAAAALMAAVEDAAAQPPTVTAPVAAFDPFPGGTAARYRFRLDSIFFGTRAAGDSARRALLARLRAAVTPGTVANPDALLLNHVKRVTCDVNVGRDCK